MRLKNLLLAGLLLMGLIISCGNKENKNNKSEKYNEYVRFYNEIKDGKLNKFHSVYIQNFSDDDLNFKEPDEAGINAVSGLNPDIEYLDKIIDKMKKEVKKNPEFKELDKSLEEFLNAMDNEKSLMNEIVSYYKNGEYKKDNFEKGKQLHQKYMEANIKSAEKYIVYSENMEKYANKLSEEELKEMKSKGSEAGYYMSKFISDIKAFSNKLYQSEEGEFSEEDIAELKKLNQTAKETYNNWIKVKGERIGKEGYKLDEYVKFRASSKNIINSMDNLMKYVEEKSDDLYPQSQKFSVSFDKFIDDYNGMIGKK